MDRRDVVRVFRERLTDVIRDSGLNRSAFARQAGIERSTLSQLLSPENDRLPRIDTLLAIVSGRQIGIDWLLGLSQEGDPHAAILPQPLEFAMGATSPVDERLEEWHAESAGYKIRYVPMSLPDLLKSEDVIAYEFRHSTDQTSESRIAESYRRLDYLRRPETDMEVCSARQQVRDFAHGHGVWSDLSKRARRQQLERMIALVDELYPTFRWFLYDGRTHYSVPLTIFGPLRAAIYAGKMYFVFNGTEHVRLLTGRFDDLIRGAEVQPTDVGAFLSGLLNEVG